MALFGSKTDVGIELDGSDEVTAGRTVALTVDVGDPDKKVQGGRAELLYFNTYREDDTDYDSDGDRTRRTVTRRTEVVVASQPLFPGGEVTAGRVHVDLDLPLSAPGSDPESVEWFARAVIDRRRAMDAKAQLPLTVLVPPDHCAGWATEGARREDTSRVHLDLELSDRVVKPGASITGTLTVQPTSPIDARAVRVQLRRHRQDPDRNTDQDRVFEERLRGEGTLTPGETLTLPFTIPVPIDAPPSFRARHNEQRWYVEGVVDLALKSDPLVALEIVVHTA